MGDINKDNIKNVIALLCKQLNFFLNIDDLKPEHFRLAKFNKSDDDVVKVFWNVLSKFNDRNDESSVSSTKMYFCRINYECLPFYSLPENMLYGSRELLLALGFVLSKGVLNDLVMREIKSSPFNPNYDITSGFVVNHNNDVTIDLNRLKCDDLQNTLEWINGKIQLNINMINEYKISIEKMLNKLNVKSDSSLKLGRLTLSQVLALHNEELCKVFLEESSRIIKLLEIHDKWLRTEVVFWKWMATVLAERNAHKNKICKESLQSFYKTLRLQK